ARHERERDGAGVHAHAGTERDVALAGVDRRRRGFEAEHRMSDARGVAAQRALGGAPRGAPAGRLEVVAVPELVAPAPEPEAAERQRVQLIAEPDALDSDHHPEGSGPVVGFPRASAIFNTTVAVVGYAVGVPAHG